MQEAPARSAAGRQTADCSRSAIVFLTLISLVGCRSESERHAYSRVWALYTEGALLEAADAAALEADRFKKSRNVAAYYEFRLLQAEALLARANVAGALSLLQEQIPNGREFANLAVRHQMDLADAYAKSKRAEDALAILNRMRLLTADADLKNRIEVLRGSVLVRLGNITEAEQVLQAAVATSVQRRDRYQQASALSNLSFCAKSRYHYADATEYGLQATGIAEQQSFKRVAGVCHLNLGSVYRILGDFDRASEHGERAIAMLEGARDQLNLLIAIGELGLTYDYLNQSDKASGAYQRAYALALRTDRDSDASRNAVNLSSLYIRLGSWDKAAEWNEKARQVAGPQSASAPYIMMNAAEIARGRGQTGPAIQLFERLAQTPQLDPNLLWECHFLLGQSYGEKREFSKADREFRTSLNIIDKTRSDLLKPAYQITFLPRVIAIHQNYVDFLIDRKDDANALRVIESSRARVLMERLVGQNAAVPRDIDIPHLTQLANDTNTSFLSFWIAPKRSFAWLIDKSGVHRFDLPPASDIEPLVTAYRETIEHPLRDPIATGDPNGPKLWNALLAQVAPHIPKNGRVVIIPDGPLHRLNFETLPVPSPKPHYWIEDVEVAIAPSLAIAASKLDAAPATAPSLLLIGAPDYNGTGFKPLDKAATEIRDIQNRFPNAAPAVFTGRQASPDAYRTAQPARFSLIHFAAHAEASRENPLESAVILTRQGATYKLYARDVIDVPIHARLVTISGCSSAGVRAYAGEGLIGFAWAFLQAGARSVVAGLWDVSDTSTEPLMNEFYAGIAAGQSPVSALRHAKLNLLQNHAYAKPFYWAPFQIYLRTAR